MPYRVWSERLHGRLQAWYRTYHSNHRDPLKVIPLPDLAMLASLSDQPWCSTIFKELVHCLQSAMNFGCMTICSAKWLPMSREWKDCLKNRYAAALFSYLVSIFSSSLLWLATGVNFHRLIFKFVCKSSWHLIVWIERYIIKHGIVLLFLQVKTKSWPVIFYEGVTYCIYANLRWSPNCVRAIL